MVGGKLSSNIAYVNIAPPTIGFTSTSSSGAESVAAPDFELTLSESSSSDVTVSYTVTGTATGSGTDYTLANGTATITAGSTTTNITPDIVDDALDEDSETLIVTISSPTNATLGANTVYTYTVTDDDVAPTISFSAPTSSGAEGVALDLITVTLSRASGKTVSANYTVSGTATGGGVDYVLANGSLTIPPGGTTANISLIVVDDVLDEANETVAVRVGAPVNATIGSYSTYTYTITDDDDAPTIGFTATSSSGLESVESPELELTLSEVSGQNVTVEYTVTGTATGSGTDYTLASGTAGISAGDTTNFISPTIIADALDEGNETVIVTISSPTNATLAANTSHTYTITDDDDAPTIGFTATSSTAAESVLSADLELTLSEVSGQDVTVSYAVTGTATGSGTDYTLVNGTATVSAGSTTTDIALVVVDDSTDEESETVIVTISSPTAATLGENTVYTYTITDNDEPPTSTTLSPTAGVATTASTVTLVPTEIAGVAIKVKSGTTFTGAASWDGSLAATAVSTYEDLANATVKAVFDSSASVVSVDVDTGLDTTVVLDDEVIVTIPFSGFSALSSPKVYIYHADGTSLTASECTTQFTGTDSDADSLNDADNWAITAGSACWVEGTSNLADNIYVGTRVLSVFTAGNAAAVVTTTTNNSGGGGGGGGSLGTSLTYLATKKLADEEKALNETTAKVEGDDVVEGIPAIFDDTEGHWARTYVEQLYDLGVVQGKDEGEFKPDAALTRAEMVKIALLTFGYEVDEDAAEVDAGNFYDVSTGSWYLPFVAKVWELGIVGGYDDGTFRPDSPITRAESLKILLMVSGVKVSEEKAAFKDVSYTEWYAKFVNFAYEKGIVNGKSTDVFAPNDNVTRAEMAKMAVKVLEFSK